MKKYIFGLLAMVISLASCTDKEEIEISYKSKITVNARHLFDSFYKTMDDDFTLSGEYGEWNLNIHSYIYDEDSTLVYKAEGKYSSLSDVLSYDLNLPPGKYITISIADFTGSYGGNNYKFWNISNENSLQDLTLNESETVCSSPFETLGITTTELTVNDRKENITIDIKPVTGLLEIIIWDDDLSGAGKNGFSFYAPYFEEIAIYTQQIKQIVKFNGTEPVYDYGIQAVRFPMQTHSPKQQYLKNGAKQILSYRALLPDNNKYFYWEVNCTPGSGKYLFKDGKDFQTSDLTDNSINIESGKQYIMDLVLDATYLFVEDYDPEKDMFERLQEHLDGRNKKNIADIVNKGYDNFVGKSRTYIDQTLGTPYSVNENIVEYEGNGLVQAITVRFTDATLKCANRIMLGLSMSKDADVEYLTSCLGKTYTVYEKGTTSTIKAFINKPTMEEATVGIIWDTNIKFLYFDAINQ